MCTNYEALPYVTSSILLLLHLPMINTFLSKQCTETASVYNFPIMWKTNFHTHTKQMAELWFCILTFTFLDSRQEDLRLWIEW
jgi:hypothetical protein